MQNLQLLNNMAISQGFADKHGYFSKRAIAEIAIRGNIVTSAGKMGDDIIKLVNDESIEEGNNSVLQNAKQRMQILRVLGLVATDYDSELYSITDFGLNVLNTVFPTNSKIIPDYTLLLEAFLGITSASEIYDYSCKSTFNCFLGYEICYALASLDYMISVQEMPLITACSIEQIDDFIVMVKKERRGEGCVSDKELFLPKTQKGESIQNLSNLTRTINQILRVCEILENENLSINGSNYYTCTEKGKKFVDSVKKKWKKFRFWTPAEFRKQKILKQKSICCLGYNNILSAGGFDTAATNNKDIFSPFQLIPETNANWFLGKDIREAPEALKKKEHTINSQVSSQILRLKPVYTRPSDFASYIKNHITKDNLIEQIIEAKNKGTKREVLENNFIDVCKKYSKSRFYPFVQSLLKIIGLTCKGEVGRIDALCEYNGHDIPVEIKSYTETPTYNLKGFRQAVENKILTFKTKDDLEYASLIVGYTAPTNITELKDFIDSCFQEVHINLIALDVQTLVKMAVNVIWEKRNVDLNTLLKSHGFAEA